MDAGLAALAETPADPQRAAVGDAARHRPRALGGHGARGLRAHRARGGRRPTHDDRAARGRDVPAAHHRRRVSRRCAPRSTRASSSTTPTRSRSTSPAASTALEAYIAAGGRRPARRAASRGATLDDADIADDKRFREAQKAVREAERALRDARKLERQAAREARERQARASAAERRGPSAPPVTAVTPVYTRPAPALECAQHSALREGESTWRSCPMCAS